MEEEKSEVGQLLRGQGWVELNGVFYPEQLRSIADQIDKNCKGLEDKNGDSK